jgi:hypothetical protein
MNADKTLDGEYSEQWAALRGLRRRLLTLAVAGAAIALLAPVSRFLPGSLGDAASHFVVVGSGSVGGRMFLLAGALIAACRNGWSPKLIRSSSASSGLVRY